MALPKITGLVIGELGTKRSEDVAAHVSEAKISYSTSGASQFDFTVSDPDLEMHNSGYFVIRRQVRYDNTIWEMAAVDVNIGKSPSVDVTCRREAVQKIKRDKGAGSFGKISPTSFASQIAKKFGLEFFGETSSAKDAIVRTQNERTDESSWDVLKRLANDIEYEMFEAGGILYFSSRKFLLSKQPAIRIDFPLRKDAPFPVYDMDLRRSDDDPLGASLTAEVDRTNGKKVRPGMGIGIHGVAFYEMPFMVDKVDWNEGTAKPVKIQAATLEDSPDTGCETKTFKKGDTGACVGRIQQAMKVKGTKTFDNATVEAVKAFQRAQKLTPVDGIVTPKVWAYIRSKT